VDLFVFSYPSPQSTKLANDTWQKIRNDLNDGFSVITDFQNLDNMHVSYTKKEMKASRNAVLKWQSDFLTNAELYGYSNYLTRASPNTFFFSRNYRAKSIFLGISFR